MKGGSLTSLRKEIGGREFYLFANSSAAAVSTPVRLRGKLRLEHWDPHAGKIISQAAEPEGDGTRLLLELPPVTATFIVGQKPQ